MTLFRTIHAEGHCDIPCGIYDPTSAKIAARTIARMIDQIEELTLGDVLDKLSPYLSNDKQSLDAYTNAVSRRMRVKDEYAELCKRELEILWSDFFKPEHLDKFPNLHEIFWKAVKLASTCKQDPHKEHAAALLAAVDEIAQMFYATKGVPDRYRAYQEITDHLY